MSGLASLDSAAIAVDPMHPGDVPAVAAIERASFPHPRDEHALLAELAHPAARARVARTPHAGVVGFMIFWDLAGELELHQVATDPAHRRAGIARALVDDLLAYARAHGATEIHLEVRRSNAAAITLYRDRFGFSLVGARPRYYADNDEDALLMRLSVDGAAR